MSLSARKEANFRFVNANNNPLPLQLFYQNIFAYIFSRATLLIFWYYIGHAGLDGKGKERRGLCHLTCCFSHRPPRAFYFSITAFFIGISSGSLCGGERWLIHSVVLWCIYFMRFSFNYVFSTVVVLPYLARIFAFEQKGMILRVFCLNMAYIFTIKHVYLPGFYSSESIYAFLFVNKL